jgi:hypothetical protein
MCGVRCGERAGGTGQAFSGCLTRTHTDWQRLVGRWCRRRARDLPSQRVWATKRKRIEYWFIAGVRRGHHEWVVSRQCLPRLSAGFWCGRDARVVSSQRIGEFLDRAWWGRHARVISFRDVEAGQWEGP